MAHRLTTLASIGAISATLFAAGCTQTVEDINRVQPNYWDKADFDGTWYVRQTTIDAPYDSSSAMVGSTSSMEKIRWEIQESTLIGYRVYEREIGQDPNVGERVDGEDTYADGYGQGRNDGYKESPVLAYAIRGHFDIQRAYNTATGEQSNLLVENYSDRPWHDRKYIRVDWSRNLIENPFVMSTSTDDWASISFFVQENEGGEDAFYEERDKDGTLRYFDVTTRMSMMPNFWACSYVQGVGQAVRGDCDADEVEMRTSLYKLPELERDYEPLHYGNDAMTKFGYFRTERIAYDRQFGFTDDRVITLANRHDLWKDDFKRGEDGEYLRDADGRRIPTPLADRTPRPVVYHLSPNFPVESLKPGLDGMTEDWNRAFTRTVAAAKGMTTDEVSRQYGDMFVLCSNPVTVDDNPACDPRPSGERTDENGDFVPFFARPGDLRRSFVYWVEQPQMVGPLGFGPSFTDPETGEIISGTAYVYGAGVDRIAQSAVNIIRYANGEISEDDLRVGDDIRALIRQNLDGVLDPRAHVDRPRELRDIPIEQGRDFMLDAHQLGVLEMLDEHGLDVLDQDTGLKQRTDDLVTQSGLDRAMLNDEMIMELAGGNVSPSQLQDLDLDALLGDKSAIEAFDFQARHRERLEGAARANIYLAEFADPAVVGTALEYKGRTDYDVIWNEMRNRVFRGVMAHEVGHTLGLRHNFQGSYDAVNFFDDYWDLKKETFRTVDTVDDLYSVNELSQNQIDGDITRYQYSSIMDYHSRFNSDTAGIGKYDEAAIIFAYSSGTYADLGEDNAEPWDQEEGYVEIFEDVSPNAVLNLPGYQPIDLNSFLKSFDGAVAASQHPLVDVHYTNLITAMGGPDAIRTRSMARYSDLKAARLAGEDYPLEVDYMFCSDEWAGATMSCNRWDLGADPFEITQWAIRDYDAYYPFTHFRRNRLTFTSSSGAGRAARVFMNMPLVYQQFFWDQYYGLDQTTSNYFTLAAYAGLNFLKRVIATPSYGAYRYDAGEDEYELVTTDPTYDEDIDLRIDPSATARRQFSRFRADEEDGYYYFQRIEEAGHFWDAFYAMQALMASSSFQIAANTQADFRSFSLPYFLMFPGTLTDLFNGVFTRDYSAFAPRVVNGKVMREPLLALQTSASNVFDPLTGGTFSRTEMQSGSPIDLSTNFTIRLYSLIYSSALFRTNFSLAYLDQERIFRVGSGEELTAGDGFEAITFTDPATGIAYGALRPTGTEGATLAAKMVERGIVLQDTLTNDPGDANARNAMAQLVEDCTMIIQAVKLFGDSPL